jgi:hypothetical protein
MDSTDDATEKYPVCPHRNTPAAFRWFYHPLSLPTFLKGRAPSRPAVAALAPEQGGRARTSDRLRRAIS